MSKTMPRWIVLAMALAVLLPLAAAADHHEKKMDPKHDDEHAMEHTPSACAEGMPGAAGTIEFAPDDWQEGETTYWKDTDGIAPGVPGCHVGTDAEGAPNGRMFGEACLPDGLLVESNPGAYAVHSHTNDLGHPDTFDCNAWCIGTGAEGGACRPVGPEVAPPCQASAFCYCG